MSKTTICKNREIRIMTNLFLVMASVLLLIQCHPNHERIDFILNSIDLSEFSVVYGMSCGEDIAKTNGRKRFVIPRSGVLIISNKYEDVPIDYRFYIENQINNRVEQIPINYHRKEDGQPLPGVRIIGLSHQDYINSFSTKVISFKLLKTETDLTSVTYEMSKEFIKKQSYEIKRCLN